MIGPSIVCIAREGWTWAAREHGTWDQARYAYIDPWGFWIDTIPF